MHVLHRLRLEDLTASCAHQAAKDAELAAQLAPGWPKPLHRLAQALEGQRRWGPAVAACRRGAAVPDQAPSVYRDFAALLHRVAMHAAQCGDIAGFDGRQLEVLTHTTRPFRVSSRLCWYRR